jgi:hypothetical protein
MGELYDSQKQCISIQMKSDEYLNLEVVNYVALASPLLSARCLLSPTLSTVQQMYFRRTGTQLVLNDGTKTESPLIYTMYKTDSPVFQCLSHMQRRITYCSADLAEWKVPYQSSAIWPFKSFSTKGVVSGNDIHSLLDDTYVNTPDTSISDHEHIIGKYNDPVIVPEKLVSLIASDTYYGTEKDSSVKSMLIEMLGNLRSLTWNRIDINLTHAQAAILNSKRKSIVDDAYNN